MNPALKTRPKAKGRFTPERHMTAALHFPGWNAKPLLTMAYLEKESRRVASRPGEVVDFWHQVLAPSWGQQARQPLVAVVLIGDAFKIKSMMMVGFGDLAEIDVPLRTMLIPSLKGLVDGLVLITHRLTDNAAPERSDLVITKKVMGLAGRKGIDLHDHIILSGENYFSFYENKWPEKLKATPSLRVRWAAPPRIRALPQPKPQEPLFPVPYTDLIAA